MRLTTLFWSSLLSLGLSLPAAWPPAAADAAGTNAIGRGACSAIVNDAGVIVSVPASGLVTVDGPRATLRGRTAEWWSVNFAGHAAAARGAEPDWARRDVIEPVASGMSAGGAWSLTRDADLEIRTEFQYDAMNRVIMAVVTFTNRGAATLPDLVYTREWRTAPEAGWSFPPDIAASLADTPPDIARRAWLVGTLPPGGSRSLRLSWAATAEIGGITGASRADAGTSTPGETPVTSSPADIDVPLSLWTGAGFPSGVELGLTNGISWGDYDHDRWPDLFSARSGNVWRNLAGAAWMQTFDLDAQMGGERTRYGSSFGDYNEDGFPDMMTEPRLGTGESAHLLRNQAGVSFVNVAGNPAIIDVRPFGYTETICWGDVNGDSWIDAFVPVYPAWVAGGPGNFFLLNRGPTGPGGEYRFNELSGPAGLDNPPFPVNRPEGAMMIDVDMDGDIDIFSNGTLYQNRSTVATPFFLAMNDTASGIGLRHELDEGATLFDYDLDGDDDLAIVYSSAGVRIWESYGDGTFFPADLTTVDNPFSGLDLGLSAEDWDLDGDIDFTTRQVFRRNQFVETGTRHFTVATHTIPAGHITSATPAWADWDRDGDLDCALGNWFNTGHFYQNTTYGPGTADADRRYVRVRVMRDSPTVTGGVETEYGACVDIAIRGDTSGHHRRKVVSSANGYLNQNEYVLTFALPADPAPGNPAEDVHLDITVDFPGLPSQGLRRIDRYVNAALGDVNLASLTDREIVVFRSGAVTVNGVTTTPPPGVSPIVTTTTGGLALAGATTPLPPPILPPAPSWFVGVAFNTADATLPLRMKEIILDGQLAAPVACGADTFNLAVWDVTDPGTPFRVPGGSLVRATSVRNRRSYFPVDVVLIPQREYRAVAGVSLRRATGITAPIDEGPLTVTGGLAFRDLAPCTGAGVAAATPITSATFMAFRFSPDLGAATDVASLTPPSAGARPTLYACRPNPFNPETVIAFTLPAASEVRLDIYDVTGRVVRELARGHFEGGGHELRWDGRTDDGADLASGIYVYRLRVNGGEIGMRKAMLVK